MTRFIASRPERGRRQEHFCAHVAIALAAMESNVLSLMPIEGLANLDVLLGLRPQRTLEDVAWVMQASAISLSKQTIA